jgi:hypothetical protein
LETTRKELTKDTSLDVDSGALNTSSGEKELIHLLGKKNEKINKNLKKKIQKEKKKMVSQKLKCRDCVETVSLY